MKKKMLSALAATVLVLALMPVSAFAHRHNGEANASSLCTLENCRITDLHRHDSTSCIPRLDGTGGHVGHSTGHGGRGHH